MHAWIRAIWVDMEIARIDGERQKTLAEIRRLAERHGPFLLGLRRKLSRPNGPKAGRAGAAPRNSKAAAAKRAAIGKLDRDRMLLSAACLKPAGGVSVKAYWMVQV